jgi:hypothetical protein
MEDNWEGGQEIKPAPVQHRPKQCEAIGCQIIFTPQWDKERRCGACRKAKKPYKPADKPF